MKQHTTKYWRFTNVGRPTDTEEGHGSTKELALAIAHFMIRVDMGSRIEFKVYRSAADRNKAVPDSQDQSLDAELAALLGEGVD